MAPAERREGGAARRRHLALVVAATVAVLVLRSALAGSFGDAGLGFAFALPVGLAAWWFGSRAGLATAAACLLLYALSHEVFGPSETTADFAVALILRVAVLTATALVLGQLRSSELELFTTREEVAALRRVLTPARIPALAGLEVSVSFLAAEHQTSGDFYLVRETRGRNILIVGDVRGHGIKAARDATLARAAFASIAGGVTDPGQILALANRVVHEAWSEEDCFLTAVCMVHDPATHRVSWAIGGHPPPITLRGLREVSDGTWQGPALGVMADPEFPVQSAVLPTGDGMVFYTDGLVEARRGEELFGVPRVTAVLAEHRGETPDEIVHALDAAVDDFTSDHLADDVCIVAVRAT